MILFLNGTSSSGKSVLAREIMRQSDRPFIYFSVDHLIDVWMDEKFVLFGNEAKSWFFKQHVSILEDVPHPDVKGPDIPKLHWDMIEAFRVLIRKGYDLIIDEVLWSDEIFEHFVAALKDADKVYLIKVICELIECERRESQRDNRYQGFTRSIYHNVYAALKEYDIEVDTSFTSPEKCALQVIQAIEALSSPKAFKHYLENTSSVHRLR